MAKKRSSSSPKSAGRLLKNLSYSAPLVSTRIGGEVPVSVLEISASDRRKMGCLPGAVFSLKIGNDVLVGMVSETDSPPQLADEEFQKRRKKEKNFGIAEIDGKRLVLHLDKRSRSAPFRFPEDGVVQAKMTIVVKPEAAPKKKVARKSASAQVNASIDTPKLGAMEDAIQRILESMVQAKLNTWIQTCSFERDGKVWKVQVSISPPQPQFKIAASVSAIYGKPSSDGMTCIESKEFRGWPANVQRAFKWATSKAEGGVLLGKKSELKIDLMGTKPKRKQIELADAAWAAMFGLSK